MELLTLRTLLSLAAGTTALLAAIYGVYYWWNNTYSGRLFHYRLFGLRRLARNSELQGQGWTKSALELGADFARFVPALTRDEFEQHRLYLKKASDIGRKPLSAAALLGLAFLIVLESFGFAYLLGKFIAREGSENLFTFLAFAVVLVIAAVLAKLMHRAGFQLYRTNLIRRCRRQWGEGKGASSFTSGPVSLNDKQGIDDDRPFYTQCINRVGDHGSYFLFGVAVAVTVLFSALTYVMRQADFDRTQGEEVIGRAPAAQMAAAGNPFAAPGRAGVAGLPDSVTAANDAARAEGERGIMASSRIESSSAFLFLSALFAATQVIGITIGHQSGFGGRESEQAYRATHGFARWQQFQDFVERRIGPVEGLMSALHKRFRNTNEPVAARTFREYLAYRRQQEPEQGGGPGRSQRFVERAALAATASAAAAPDYRPPQSEATLATGGTAAGSSASGRPPSPAPVHEAGVDLVAPSARPDAGDAVESHLARLDALATSSAKEDYVLGLDEETRARVVAAVRARKDARQKALEAQRAGVAGLFD